MNITVSKWLMSLLNMYNYPVVMFDQVCWPGGSASGAGITVYLYSLKYDNANNTINVIYIFDPAHCNIGSVSPCGISRFDNTSARLLFSALPISGYLCQYSVYEVISLIGAN